MVVNITLAVRKGMTKKFKSEQDLTHDLNVEPSSQVGACHCVSGLFKQ